MKHIGTRGGPMGDDELPTLDPRLAGLSGPELLRASLALVRPPPTAPRTRTTPSAPPRPPGRPEKGTPEPQPTEFPVAHWAGDIPAGPEPEEEDWR